MSGRQMEALRDRLLALPPEARSTVLGQLTRLERRALNEMWEFWALDGQRPPGDDWRVWMMQCGRGFGKTRTGAEWVSAIARTTPKVRIALVAATRDEARRVMVEGESGILAVAHAHERVVYHRTRGEIEFADDARAFLFSADAPESLRGAQHHFAWCDELAKWRYGEAAWDNLTLGVRLGNRPRFW